jgi:O-antigen ligase
MNQASQAAGTLRPVSVPRSNRYQPPPVISLPQLITDTVENPLQRLGAFGLFLLLFCSLSRVTDFFLQALHLPFLLSIVCCMMALASQNILAAFKSRVGIALLGFSFWLVAAIPTSVWHGSSFTVVFDGWSKSMGLFVVTVALLSSLRQSSRVMRVMAVAFFATAILGLFYGKTSDGRFGLDHGLYAGSNELATAMVEGCIFSLFMIHSPKSSILVRILSMLAIIPLLIILLNTASRAGVIALAVLTVMTFFHYSVRGKITLAVIVIVGLFTGIALIPGSVKRRIATTLTQADASTLRDEAMGSKMQRMYLLKRSIDLTLKHPIFGVGPGQFVVGENDVALKEGRRGQWLGTHNTYTQISSEAGIPALLFFVASLFYCWRELRASERIHKSLQSPESGENLVVAHTLKLALVSYVVFFCFEHIAYDPFYPVVAGVIVAFSRTSRMLAAQPAQSVPAVTPFPTPMLRRPV